MTQQHETTARHAAPVVAPPERTVGQLVADASHDVSTIIRSEIALAKLEVTSGAKGIGKGAGFLAAAGVLAIFGLIYLLHALAHVIGIWLPLWAGYLIVAALILIPAVVLALLGIKALKKAKPAPERAIKNAQQTVAALKPGH
ncbi:MULTISPECIES: phage holin family protein [unclassified Janibacter]|uniref:phage holin family protein n=1 Tax=unclassified Janibacter TaxID=2649294 RepID=UPI003D05FAA1